jgi:nicotinamide mononucleotide transporter
LDALLHALQAFSAPAFTAWGAPVSWLEGVAVLLSVQMVVFNVRVDARGWPLAIVSSLLYLVLFWQNRLYGDAGLQVFFALVAGWGWWQWLRGTGANGDALHVRRLTPGGRIGTVVAIALLWPATGWLLKHATDTDVPWWDAFPTAASVVGQWLLGRKYLENWSVWVVVNTVSVGLFAYKGLWLTTLLYAVFIAMSVAGWRAWRRRIADGTDRTAS